MNVLGLGGDAIGSPSETLPLFPSDTNVYSPGDTMTWVSHGIRLGYFYSQMNGQNINALGGITQTPPLPPLIRLMPQTMLVPIQMVRVLNTSPDATQFPDIYDVTARAWQKWWDDRPLVDVSKNYGNANPPYLVTETDVSLSEGTPPQLANNPNHQLGEADAYSRILSWYTVPDSIFDACNVQFRMVDCQGNNGPGCPDLLVSDDTRIGFTVQQAMDNNGALCQPPEFPLTSENWDDASKLPGIRNDIPIVTAVWNIDPPCGDPNGGSGGGWTADVAQQGNAPVGRIGMAAISLDSNEMAYWHGGQPIGNAAAHEMGHVLGLGHVECDPKHQGNLMCPTSMYGGTNLEDWQCAIVRKNAAVYVKAYWGVTVAP
jgi:hypothetical protein